MILLQTFIALLLIVLIYLEGVSPSRLTLKVSNNLNMHAVTTCQLKKNVLLSTLVLIATVLMVMSYSMFNNDDIPKEKPVIVVPLTSVEGLVRQLPPVVKPTIKNKATPNPIVTKPQIIPPVEPQEIVVPDKNAEVYRKICKIYRSC